MNKLPPFPVVLLIMLASGILVQSFSGHLDKPQEPKEIPLFSCYKLEGTKCTVTSNKDKPCSYTVVICRTPDKKEIFRGEKEPKLVFNP